MKKCIVVILVLTYSLILCSCSADTSGYVNELTEFVWIAETKGGAKAELLFEKDKAFLTLESGNTKKVISGKYVADEESFVIFVPELYYNYKFDYVPSCNTLKLIYNDMTVEFTKK